MTRRVVVLASGRGTNLQALLDADLSPARVVLVVSEKRGAEALERATRAGVETDVLRVRDFPDRDAWDRALAKRLGRAGIDIIVSAGFNRVLGPTVLAAYPTRILNVHPALLPAFGGGLHAVEDALAYGVKVTGCTVHFVTDEVDAGPIVLQHAVEVREDDDADSLAARIHAQEHVALPEAVRLLAAGRLRVEGRLVRITQQPTV